MRTLKSISEKLKKQIKKLKLKVRDYIKEYEEISMELFDKEQKIKLYEILMYQNITINFKNKIIVNL